MSVYEHGMYALTWVPEGDVGTQALQLQAIVSNLIWVVGIEPKSLARAVRILKPLSILQSY